MEYTLKLGWYNSTKHGCTRNKREANFVSTSFRHSTVDSEFLSKQGKYYGSSRNISYIRCSLLLKALIQTSTAVEIPLWVHWGWRWWGHVKHRDTTAAAEETAELSASVSNALRELRILVGEEDELCSVLVSTLSNVSHIYPIFWHR